MYLVIGGTGTIGREVVRLLAAGTEPVRALVRDPFRASALAGPRVTLVQGDLARPESLPAAFDGVRRMFLVTPPGPDTVPLQSAALAAARAAGVERLVRISVMGAGTGMPVKITDWHTEVEHLVAASGIPAVQLRPTSYMQNFFKTAELIRTTGQMFGSAGDGAVALVDTRDIAAAAVGALTRADHEDETPHLTGPAALTGPEVAETFARVLGRPVSYVDLPSEAMKAGLLGAGMPEWLATDLVTLDELGRGRVMPVTGDIERLAGHPPRSLETFVRDHRSVFA